MKKIIELIKNKWLKETLFTILLVATVFAVYIALNMGVHSLELSNIDLTSQKLYSLSEESKNIAKGINKEIKIYMFGFEEKSDYASLAKQYAKISDNISLEVVSTVERQDLAEEFNITSNDETSGVIVFTCEDRKIKISSYDLYTVDYNTGERIDLLEQKLTNSLLAVTLENAPKIYFLTGHGERTLQEYFQTLSVALKSEVNEVEELDLLVQKEIPEACQTLVIASPSTDFTDVETEAIMKYINNGGNILFLSDYSKNGVLTNVKKILDTYGITLKNNGVLLEQDASSMLLQNPELILPRISTEAEITRAFAKSGKVLFLDSGVLEKNSEEKLNELGVDITELLITSNKSIFKTDLKKAGKSDEEEKSYLVGALASKKIEKEDSEEVTSNLVIYANCLFATDYPIAIGNQASYSIYFYNNQDLVLNTISYLTERTDTITVRKTNKAVTYTPTKLEDTVVKVIIFTFPVIILCVGIVITIVRRNRR